MNTPEITFTSTRPNPFGHLIKPEEYDKTMGIKPHSSWLFGTERVEDNWAMQYPTPPWIDDIHNKYSGTAFILGTGPSLVKQVHLLPQLIGKYTFTCNRMRLWGEVPFAPFVHCVTEPQPFLEWGLSIVPVYDHPKAQNRVGCIWTPIKVPGWLWCPKAPETIQIRWQGFMGFQEEFRALPTGWASPLTIAQLAVWMGFRTLVFMGVDTTNEGQAWDVEKARAVFPRNIRSILECFDRARMDIQANGAKVWDCTPGGRLSREGVLPYRDLAEVLNEH